MFDQSSHLLRVTAFVGAALVPVAASAAPVDIQVVFSTTENETLTTSQQAIFTQAEAYWEAALTGYNPLITNAPAAVVIQASAPLIDGVNGVLGSAGPTFVSIGGGFAVTTAGVMQFDSVDIDALETNGTLFDVIQHEMAHVLGFGTLWNLEADLGAEFAGTQAVYVRGSGEYTGTAALAAYNAEFDPLATFVPVDIVSGPGTADGHWDENWAGGRNDLMTGFLDAPTFVSDTTLASFIDIGYLVDLTVNDALAPVPVPPGILLGLSGLGLMGFVGRRRRKVRAA
ncbi:leishmanolysin [Jannaschia sp.]|nr:leishmanolysin [Jannaschia sp.]